MTQPTQSRHPWRATTRTVAAGVIAALPFLPVIAETFGVQGVGWVAAGLSIVGGVTRLLAMPGVNGWLQRFAPFLAAAPKPPPYVAEMTPRRVTNGPAPR